MSRSDPNCPACREPMELGMVYDRGHGGSLKLAEWVKGPPEDGGFFVGLKTKGKETHTVVTYRCPRCGLLQQYALS